MARAAKVPIDMSSEQKEILGIASKRQLTYVAGGGILLYSYVPLVFKLMSNFGWIAAVLSCIITAMPVIGILFFLGFTKVEKYNMNRDYYYLIMLQKRTQYGSWRKGF